MNFNIFQWINVRYFENVKRIAYTKPFKQYGRYQRSLGVGTVKFSVRVFLRDVLTEIYSRKNNRKFLLNRF